MSVDDCQIGLCGGGLGKKILPGKDHGLLSDKKHYATGRLVQLVNRPDHSAIVLHHLKLQTIGILQGRSSRRHACGLIHNAQCVVFGNQRPLIHVSTLQGLSDGKRKPAKFGFLAGSF